MLIGRKVGQYNQKIVYPGPASLVLTGSSPSISTTFNTILIWHAEGSDADTGPFNADYSLDSVTFTAAGTSNAEIDTAQFKFGSSSLLLATTGLNSVIETSDGPDWTPSLKDKSWSLDFWFRSSSGSTIPRWSVANGANTLFACQFLADFTNDLLYSLVLDSVGGNILDHYTTAQDSVTFSANTWYHFALQRNKVANTWGGWINGTPIWSVSNSNDTYDIQSFNFATSAGFSYSLWLDEVRVTNDRTYTPGVSFSPPTVPYA